MIYIVTVTGMSKQIRQIWHVLACISTWVRVDYEVLLQSTV